MSIRVLSDLVPAAVGGKVVDYDDVANPPTILAVGTTAGTVAAGDAAGIAKLPAITDHGAAVAGNVVRTVSAGVFALAQADSIANSSGISGVYDGSRVVPFTAQPVAIFDSAPVVGRPCYVSATTAGALTSSPLRAHGIALLPHDTIALEGRSVGTDYRALVGKASLTSDSSLRDVLRSRAIALTGINPSICHQLFTDFSPRDMTDADGNGGLVPSFGFLSGTSGAVAVPTAPNQWNITGGGVLWKLNPLLSSELLTHQKWSLSTRWKNKTASSYLAVSLTRGTADLCGIVLWPIVLSTNRYMLWHGANIDPVNNAPVVGTTTDTGVLSSSTAAASLDMYSSGNGSVSLSVNGATPVTAAFDGVANAALAHLRLSLQLIEFEYLSFCSEK